LLSGSSLIFQKAVIENVRFRSRSRPSPVCSSFCNKDVAADPKLPPWGQYSIGADKGDVISFETALIFMAHDYHSTGMLSVLGEHQVGRDPLAGIY
jgi:hypothetical protein